MNTGAVRKIVLRLSEQRPAGHDVALDGVLLVERACAPHLLALEADERAVALLELLHVELRNLAATQSWDTDAFDAARSAALASGVVARLDLPRAWHRTRRWYAEAFGHVDDAGLHLDVRIVDAGTEATVAEGAVHEPGDWHRLRATRRLRWTGDEVATAPVVRSGVAMGTVLTVRLPSLG